MKLLVLSNNQYLSDKQCGIQGQHALAAMLTRYTPHSQEYAMAYEWATEHKTIVLLRGGNSITLAHHFDFLDRYAPIFSIPYALFKEDATLNFALTSVCFVLPDSLPYANLHENESIGDVEFDFERLKEWAAEFKLL